MTQTQTLYQQIKSSFYKHHGRYPNPLEVAHNIPNMTRDGEAMQVMVEAMQDPETEPVRPMKEATDWINWKVATILALLAFVLVAASHVNLLTYIFR